MKCVLIGYGKVAQTIIDNFNINTCFARNISKTENPEKLYPCKFIDSYDDIPNADLYIICVNDDSITEVVKNLKTVIPNNSVVAHTSGSVPIELISKHFENAAVIYPLHPFAQAVKVNFDNITMLIENANNKTNKIITEFLSQKNCTVNYVDSLTRMKIHISAVFACNFVNHMITLSESYLSEIGYDVKIISPLIKQTFENILQTETNIIKLQTGPAIREEYKVIDTHLNILKDNPKILEVYKALTNSIINIKNDNKKL